MFYAQIMSFISTLGGMIKSGYKKTAETAEKLVELLPWPLNRIITGVRKGIGTVLRVGSNLVTREVFPEMTKEVKKKITSVKEGTTERRKKLAKVIDERTVLGGAHVDQTVGELVEKIGEVVGPSEEARIRRKGGPLLAAQEAVGGAAERWTQRLKRKPPEPGTDEEVIGKEKNEEQWLASLEEEEKITAAETDMTDRPVIDHLLRRINKIRGERGKPLLYLDPELRKLAEKRAARINKSGTEKLVPLTRLLIPPLTRKKEEKTVTNFSAISEEEKKLIERGTLKEKDEAPGTFIYTLLEDKALYAQRCREAQQKRESIQRIQYEPSPLTFDLNENNYLFENSANRLLELMLEREDMKTGLFGDTNRIGIGLHREGTKVTLAGFFRKDDAAPAIEIPAEELPEMTPDVWLKKIPEKEPGAAQECRKIFKGSPPREPPFNSGYSLYQYYLFSKEIENLKHQGRNVVKKEYKIVLDDPISAEKSYDTLKIPLVINDHPEVIKLIKGTDIVFIEQAEEVKEKKAEAPLRRGIFMRLSEYLKQLKPRKVQREYPEEPRQPQQRPQVPEQPQPEEVIPGTGIY